MGRAVHYTGSKAHDSAVRKLGVARGLKINEYGVFRGTRRVAGATGEACSIRSPCPSLRRSYVGRKLLPDRYDAFRLHVSSSYREVFERTLHQVLESEAWQIVRVKGRRISAHGSDAVLVPLAVANGAPLIAKRQLGDVLI